MFSSNIPCTLHASQQSYFSGICLFNQCENQPAMCTNCQLDYHFDHKEYCYSFAEIEQKTQYLDQVMDIQQPYNIFKKEVINLLNYIGSEISQSTYTFASKFHQNKQTTKAIINELGNVLRNTQEQISKRKQILSFFNEFQVEFEKRTKQFVTKLQYSYPKALPNQTNRNTQTKQTNRLIKRSSQILTNSQSNNISKVDISRISRARSDYSLDVPNKSQIIQCQEFNEISFRVDFNQKVGDIKFVNDTCVKSSKGGMVLLYPSLNEIRNNYIKLSFQITTCQRMVSLGVATNTSKCSFANIESSGKVYSSWNFSEHNKQCRVKFGQSDIICCYVNKFQKTLEFSKNDRNIEVRLSKVNFDDMKFYIYMQSAQVEIINNKEIVRI